MRFWTVIHTHRFGVSTFVVESDTRPDDNLIEEYAIKTQDYEPDREDEYLEMEEVTVIPINDIMGELTDAN